MFITRIKLKNWKNFREADIHLRECTYIIGANASGKSNLLDVFRFLRDISKPQGGGLQKAVSDRGEMSKLRCLHARQDTDVRIEIHLSSYFDAKISEWEYSLAFNVESRGLRRLLIKEESVKKNGKSILIRPTKDDEQDKERLTQTYLEQIQSNANFREIAEFFAGVNYLHLVPQLLKYNDRIGGQYLEGDPFGQGFLKRLADTPKSTRSSRIKKIQKALEQAIPQFSELVYETDNMGHPHLKANYTHHRPQGSWQAEEQFSDGTLRLIGILWSLLENNSLLLLEEPELSLHDAIIEQIPLMLHNVQKKTKSGRQIIITTHSEALLTNKGIDAAGLVILEPSPDGTVVRSVLPNEIMAIKSGFSIAEVVLPKTKPSNVEQLGFW